MTKQDLLKRVVLLAVFIFTIGGISLAQTATEFWHAFDKCAEISQFQAHYPSVASGETLSHVVMNNGINIPATAGVTFQGNYSYALEDKGAVIGNGVSEFFIIQDARFTSTGAHFEVIYYYNFDGSYSTFVRAVIELANSSGIWTVTSTSIQ